MKNIDEHFMKIALKEAEKARDIDEVPIGAVIVKDNIVQQTYVTKFIVKNLNRVRKHK